MLLKLKNSYYRFFFFNTLLKYFFKCYLIIYIV